MNQLEFPFFDADIVPQKAGNRRRCRPVNSDSEITSRQERLQKRNRLLAARYYYWTEIKRRRFDDVLQILSDNEFFLDERSISNTLVAEDEYYTKLVREKTSPRKLKSMFPGWDWT